MLFLQLNALYWILIDGDILLCPQTQEEVYVLKIMLYIFQTFGEVANIVYDDSAPSVIISYVSRQQAEKVSLINLV